MRTWGFFLLAVTSACLRQTEFHCETSDQCGTGGTCESVGFCSFADPDCGRRFGPQAGMYANSCVGGMTDGGVDGKPLDGLIDSTGGNHCPSGFNTITNGTTGHRYKKITASDTWQTQRDGCAALSTFAYLAIPDDMTEMGAFDGLEVGSTPYWLGIDDLVTEGTFVTVKNATPAYLPWLPPAPDDAGPGEDCVEGVGAGKINDDRCNTQLPAICECEE